MDIELQFIPTPQTSDLEDLHASIKRFARHIQLRYFSRHNINQTKRNILRPNLPGIHRVKMTISIKYWNKRNPSIIIKPADIDSATVIMSKKNFIAEAERQLSNQKHYAKFNTPVYPQAAVRISATLDNDDEQDLYPRSNADT